MRKKLIILITIVSSLIVVFAISAFAYFNITNSKQITTTNNLNDDYIIEISSFSDLINYSKETKYNDHNESSEIITNTAARETLKFTSSIVLHNNIEITTDCNIDLNGNNLYLNGYNLFFNHSYYGSFQIYSSNTESNIYSKEVTINEGEITENVDGDFGYIVINTPNAIIMTDNVEIPENTLKTNAYNDLYVAYYALYNVADALVDYSDIRPDKLLPENITTGDKITSSNSVYTFDSSLFIPSRNSGDDSTCNYSNTIHNCSYIYKDIDLPFNYSNYKNITIEYVSSNDNVLSNYGEVTLPSNNSTLTLTANIKKNDTIIASSTFNLHVINPASAAIIDAAKAIFYSRIEDHYNSEQGKYVFDREILLPKIFGDATFSYLPYKVSTAEGAEDIFNDGTSYKSLGGTNVSSYNDYLWDFSPTSESSALKVTITANASSETFYIKMASNNSVINNEYSIARDIINSWYGGKISLKKNGENDYDTKELYGYGDIDHVKYSSVNALTYNIINDSHDLYGITAATENTRAILHVNSGKAPENYVQNVMLSCNFVIGGKSVSIQIPIEITQESSMANAFLPYYTYYDELVKYSYNNYVSQNFELPLSYSNTGPIICYDFAEIPNNYNSLDDKTLSVNPAVAEALTVVLYYNGQERTTLSFEEGVSYTTKLDAALTTLGVTLQEVLAFGDAKWIYKFNVADVPNKNTSMALIYNYKMTYANTSWTTFCENETDDQKFTKFTLAGVLHYGTDVVSEVFYKWIYDNFTILADDSNNKLVYATGDYNAAVVDSTTGKYVLIDWLEQNVSVDVTTDSTIASITDFTGLQFLVGTKYLDLTGVYPENKALEAINAAREIAKMKNLETLILKNNKGFTDGKVVWSSEDYDNDSISRFSKLKNLKYLDLENCNIMLFDFLDTMTWLSEVNVVGNYYNDDATNYFNNFYGSEGICNFTTYGDLIDAGVKVYVKRQGSGLTVFEAEASVNDYMRLRNAIVYQSKLAYGVDISVLYASFPQDDDSGNTSAYLEYHFEKFYNVSFPPSNQKVTFEPVLRKYYVEAETFDNTKTYYVVDDDSTVGYSVVASPVETNIDSYYLEVEETETNCTAFAAIYSFTLNNTANIKLKVKFNVERYNNEE